MSIIEDINERRLPSILNGSQTLESWKLRRNELLNLIAIEEYGFSPPPPDSVKAELLKCEQNAWAGKAEYRNVDLSFQTQKGFFSFPIHIVLPKSSRQLPLIIYISFLKYSEGQYCPIEEIIDNNFALATFYYNDVTEDREDNFSSGLAAMYDRDCNKQSQWGKISMWAWAASRVMDYVQTIEAIDKSRIFCVGHSRLGKTALWCGAQDERFAGAVSNDSGCSGAAITREKQGERVKEIIDRFPYWFCENYQNYIDNEHEMPFDQHQLIALMAPRLVYAASAAEDIWADPYSEFLSCVAANEAYNIFGKKGLVHGNRFINTGEYLHEGEIGYHLRAGTHFLSRYDWQMFMRFMEKH